MTSIIAEGVLFISRSLVASILFKASIVLALGLIVAKLAGRCRAALRHIVLAATFGALILLPLIAAGFGGRFLVEIPASAGSEPVAARAGLPSFTGVSSTAISEAGPSGPGVLRAGHLSWEAAGGFIWMTGTVIFLLPLAVNLWWLRGLRRSGIPWPEMQRRAASLADECGVRRPVEVVLHEDTPTPLTCGFWRPAIILPCDARSWNDVELRCALIHELEHVRRGDWATQIVARAICACYWFHPVVWMGWQRLCLEAERACDDAVIENEGHTEYAEQLVSLARRMPVAHAQPAVGMANRSDLSRRISAVLDARQPRGRAGLLAAAGTWIAAGLVVFVIAPLHAVAQLPRNQQSTSEDKQARRPSTFDRALYEAAEAGELTDIDRLLNAGANINCAIPGDGSPLIGAARKGKLTAVVRLLDRGADPNMPVSGDGNPLIMAAAAGHTDVVSLLLDRGARIDEVVPSDENALIQASGKGYLDVVKILVSRRANVNMRLWVEQSFQPGGGEWRSPLSMARKGGHAEVAAYLLSAGARE